MKPNDPPVPVPDVPAHLADIWVHSLPEVSAITGLSWRYLVNGCRKDLFDHVHQGDFRGMNRDQMRRLVERHSPGGDLDASAPKATPIEQARSMTRAGAASRQTRRTA